MEGAVAGLLRRVAWAARESHLSLLGWRKPSDDQYLLVLFSGSRSHKVLIYFPSQAGGQVVWCLHMAGIASLDCWRGLCRWIVSSGITSTLTCRVTGPCHQPCWLFRRGRVGLWIEFLAVPLWTKGDNRTAFPLSCSVNCGVRLGKLSAVLNSHLKQRPQNTGMSAYSLPPSKKLYLPIFLVFLTVIECTGLAKRQQHRLGT